MRLTPLILCVALGCAVKKEKPGDTVATVDTLAEHSQDDTAVGPSTTPSGTGAPSRPGRTDSAKAPSPPASRTPDMTVTEYGIGPIRAGMTVEEVAQAMGGGFGAPKGGTAGCTYAVLVKAPPGLAVMLQDGR